MPELAPARWIHLRAAGVSLLLELSAARLPLVRHWGADLGELAGVSAAALDAAWGRGAAGLPILALPGVDRGPLEVRTRLLEGTTEADLVEVGPDIVVVEAETGGELSLDLAVQLTADGVVRCRAGLTNRSDAPHVVESLTLRLPVGSAATHRIELGAAGPAAHPLGSGGSVVEVVPETGGPAYAVVGSASAGYRRGEVWQCHVAFSGAVRHRVEQRSGRCYLSGGEVLQPAELTLAAGESYHSPWVLWSCADGLDAAAARLHRHVRRDARPAATVFDASGVVAEQDLRGLLSLAEYAAAVGADTFMLNLGWCIRAGLAPHTDSHGASGDGMPQDLDGLLGRIQELDLEVGLRITPEVTEVDETLLRDHPDWLMAVDVDGEPVPALDLSVRPAMGFLWERLTKLLDRHEVAGLRWDLQQQEASSRHRGTLAAYRLLDALRERYPRLSISTDTLDVAVAGRALGVVAGDASSQQLAFADLTQVLPPELLQFSVVDGSDQPPTYQATSWFAGPVALHRDLRQEPPAALRSLHRWLSLHRRVQPWLEGGQLVRSDPAAGGPLVRGIVAADQERAVYAVVSVEPMPTSRRVHFEGLDPVRSYRVDVTADPAEAADASGWSIELSGRLLGVAGLELPAMRRDAALLVLLEAVTP